MRKRSAVVALIGIGVALAWAGNASTHEASLSGTAIPQIVFVPNAAQLQQQQQQIAVQRQAEEQQAESAYAKVTDLRDRVQAHQDAYEARMRAELGPRAPESTMAPVPTVPPMETMSPDDQ